MSTPDPITAQRLLLLSEASVTALLLPQAALPSLATAPIFAYEYPRRRPGDALTGYTGHDWSALLHQRAIDLVLITPSGRIDSGGDSTRAPWSRVRFDVQTYGRTDVTASAVHWAIYEFLKEVSNRRAILSAGHAPIRDVTIEGGPISFPDPTTECPVMVGIYAATVVEEYVA